MKLVFINLIGFKMFLNVVTDITLPEALTWTCLSQYVVRYVCWYQLSRSKYVLIIQCVVFVFCVYVSVVSCLRKVSVGSTRDSL